MAVRKPLTLVVALAAIGCSGVGEDEATSASRQALVEELAEAGTYSGYTPLGLQDDRVTTVFVELSGKPVAVAQAEAGRKLASLEKANIKATLRAQQDALRPAIERLGGVVLGEYQVAINGLKVQIAARNVAQLQTLQGVARVRPVAIMERNHTNSVPYIGAPAAWNGVAGYRGEGVTVAVIDTGVDFTHAMFGGPGTIAAYDAADAVDTLPADPVLFGPQAPKVVGGFDLAGDDYHASAGAPPAGQPDRRIPQPDPNPLDCGGHGSHVAGSVAGFGVNQDGTTYAGPWDASTFSHPFRIGPGVAPQAKIYAIRVFGCEGSTNLTVDAIDLAVDQGVDVINMSLGSAFGSEDDASAAAAHNAARAGVVVVVSAGNNGASQYIVGSPGTATAAITVASMDARQQFAGANIGLSSGALTSINANGASLPAGALPIHVLKNADGTISLGCNPAEYFDAAGNSLVSGKMVVSVRGTCARVARAVFAQKAGAAAAVMINTDSGFPPFEGQITSNPDTGEQYVVTIPFLGVRGVLGPAATVDGDRLVAADGQSAGLTATTIANPAFKAFAGSTSSGARTGDSWLKPDVSAPGVSIMSAGVGSGNAGAISSGTSMAAPHVSGVAALVRQAHPSWKVEDIKAAIVNTANASGVASFRVSRGGGGLVQPAPAVATSVVAIGDHLTASLSYGFAEFHSDYSKTKTITLRNHGEAAAAFNVSTVANAPFTSPHAVAVSTSSVTVPAGGTATVDVTLTASAAAVGGSNAFKEIAGKVVFTPASASSNGGVSLSVPYYLVPRPFSKVAATLDNNGRFSAADLSAEVRVRNSAPAVEGTADFYVLGLEDGRDQGVGANDLRAVGAQSFATPTATDPGRRLLVFAVSVYDRWSNAAVSEVDLDIDVDNDGVIDYIAVLADAGLLLGTGNFDGRMAVGVFSTRSPGASVQFLATAPHDSGVLLAPVRIGKSGQLCRTNEPCLSQDNPRFTYSAVSFALRSGGDDVMTDGATLATAKFNGWNSSISQGMFVGPLAPGAEGTAVASLNAPEWALTPARGVMVVSTENKSGVDEAQLIPVSLQATVTRR